MLCTTAESQDGIGALERGGEIPSVHFFEKLKKIPNHFCNVVESTEVVKSSVFMNIRSCFKDHKWLCESAILAPKNNNVNAINPQMSINKVQGQSLKVADIHLETSDFSHGQLYVGCSRMGTEKNLYAFVPDGKHQKHCLSNRFKIKIVLY